MKIADQHRNISGFERRNCRWRNLQTGAIPVLPPYWHIPDSEAHVMPDGKLYIYGSYDDGKHVYWQQQILCSFHSGYGALDDS